MLVWIYRYRRVRGGTLRGGAVRDAGGDCLAHRLAALKSFWNLSCDHALETNVRITIITTTIATERLEQRTTYYLERLMDIGTSLEACRRADNGVQGAL